MRYLVRWRNNYYGGMDVSETRWLKTLEAENAKPKKLVAEQLLAIDALKECSRGKQRARSIAAGSSGSRTIGNYRCTPPVA